MLLDPLNSSTDILPARTSSLDGWRSKIVDRIRPSSVLQLLLMGFALVALPLVGGLLTAYVSVDRLSLRSVQAVMETAKGVLAGQNLYNDITQMERNARQFQILGDQSFYQLAEEQRASFLQSVDTLRALQLPAELRQRIDRLLTLDQQVFSTLKMHPTDSREVSVALDEFSLMANQSRDLWQELTTLIARDTEHLRDSAGQLQSMLAWLAAGLILAALGISVGITLLLARPIQQLKSVIRTLGRGDYTQPITIGGPRDLEEVGARLDWMRRQLQLAEYQQARFLRHVSHELKTPLTAIREGSELLRDQVPGPLNNAQSEVTEILRDNSVRLQRLIEDLLSFTVSGTPSAALERTPVKLKELTHQAVDLQKLALSAKSLSVDPHLDSVTLDCDHDKLRQILDNLLSNAIKHAPAGGTVRIDLGVHDDHAVIDVIDDGPGIDDDEREHVFEAFYQGRAPASGHVSGTGLGLAICREYVNAHGGTIRVLPRSHGAHLRVRLPLKSGPRA